MRSSCVLLLGLLTVLPASSGEDRLLQLFESRYRSAHTMEARFLERYYENGRQVRAEAGRAYFQRPGKMRWDYESPEKNTFLVDGKFVWFYSPTDHTVTRMAAKQSEDWRTPLAFLASHVKLSRICGKLERAAQAAPEAPDDEVYACTLREGSDFPGGRPRVAKFEVSPAGELVRISLPQEGGVLLEFSFGGWRWNPELEKSLFQFSPPRDTVIVDGLLP